MQNHFAPSVIQENMRPIICLCPVALISERCGYLLRHAEELQRLVDQVGTNIEPQTASWARQFTPPFTNLRAKTVHVRFKVQHISQQALFDDISNRHEIAVPASVVENR